ncbi:MAG: hypothetical protein U1D30_06600 [Planctomycetota bacterium]
MVDFLDRIFRRTPGPSGKNDSSDPTDPKKIPATPGSVGSATESRASLQQSLAKVDAMIAKGRSMGLVHAPNNLQHWRDGSGTLLTMPTSAFENEAFIKNWLKTTVRQKFVDGTERRLRAGQAKPTDRIDMHYESARDLYAPFGTDLFFALGGFTIRSEVVVQGEQNAGFTIFQFQSWTCMVKDDYNWDPGKTTWVPGFGVVTDDELRTLEKAGYGKEYPIVSKPWNVADPTVLQEFSISGF